MAPCVRLQLLAIDLGGALKLHLHHAPVDVADVPRVVDRL